MSTKFTTSILSNLLAAAFCVALPFVWNHFAPTLVEEEPIHHEYSWQEHSVEIPKAGRYSVYGSSNVGGRPLDLWIGDTFLSGMAFFHVTGSHHRIATGVPLDAGMQRIRFVDRSNPDTRGHILRFELRREEPLGVFRFLALFALGFAAIAARRLLLAHVVLSPSVRVAATLAGVALATGLPLAWWAWQDGASLRAMDRADEHRSQRTAELERYLASDAHLQARSEDHFSVFVLGDSTHFWTLPDEHGMVLSIRHALSASEQERIEVYGLAYGGASVYDFMFLLQRIVDEQPDLVIMPVNFRSLGEGWASNEPDYRRVEQYLRLEDLPDSYGLSFGVRTFDWTRILTSFLDTRIFASEAAPFLHGAARYARKLRASWAEQWIPKALREPAPKLEPALLAELRSIWGAEIHEHSRQIDAFRRISRVAARHEIPLIYYTAQPNEMTIRARGFDPHVGEKFARIGTWIGREPHVTYIDLSEESRESMFSDDLDHLSIEGVRFVAGRLAESIVTHARAAR